MLSKLAKARSVFQSTIKGISAPFSSSQQAASSNLQSFYDFPVLNMELDKDSDIYKSNMESSKKINSEFQAVINKILEGGPKTAHDKLKERKKLPVRERIAKLLDPGSPFLELSQLAGYELYGKEEVPSGGVVTGVGLIHNKFCVIVANDPTVKGGSYYPITVKKHLRAQEIAEQNNLPCVYLVDSGGANLPRQDDVFPDKNHFGRIFYNQANLSAKGIPQIALVLGSCTAGGAYVPAMSDENVIVKGNGTVFLGGPPLVKAATGEIVSAEDLGGADVHCKVSGLTDHYAHDELEALRIGRSIVKNLKTPEFNFDLSNVEAPLYDPVELNAILSPDLKKSVDSRHVIARIVDGSKFQEFKKEYGSTLVTGFAKLYNQEVGIVANNGVLFSESALKGAHFIELCSQRNIPLIFLQNITGFMVGSKYESEGIAKHGAKMVNAVSTSQVPKLSLLFGGSFGAGNYGMCGRAYSPNYLFSWPISKISVMGGEQAAGVMLEIEKAKAKAQKKDLNHEELEAMRQKFVQAYEKQASIYHSSSRLWDDGVILPEQTRELLGLSLLTTLANKQIQPSKFGVFRM
ncbi:methylcrotonyl-CoA carboxylase beta chain, putative (macronuclear) [Tetrahymena thermophila SB210]|uniref:methylcrotonoyl-CoA carboxylase n=1 Tax=Tetrahymena thermophila (strain SB210) TaxID=312017 RepID=Q236J1_TETTS|nr:methylcrotonyl-CoA carboxylase beta chain, putative [Tetrahymena thermophila SB210]EAR92509.1 methylcrotonyl-CoA carboxylase beta chain, putative [Tetrahymena thermophila SB210]|eukprot:XP_001012754.1 methylcrotonyl-CoA carboxylase beta chain, putative [Tetrahymena thermophila SB210]